MTEVKVNTITVTDASSYHNVKIDVPLNLKSLSSDPADGVSTEGDIYYNTTSNKVRFRDDSSWTDL